MHCPNVKCPNHTNPTDNFFSKSGFFKTTEGLIQRLKCKNCLKRFSPQSFKLDYRAKKRELFEEIFICTTNGMSNRSIARKLKVAESSVRDKIKILSRQALLHLEKFAQKIQIKETVAFDGFETFVYSQYHPNNINHAVGKDSLFLYDFSYAHLNRKGRMTEQQKIKREQMRSYPRNTLIISSARVLKTIHHLAAKKIDLYTDEHLAYPKALTTIKNTKLKHLTINSRKTRNAKNPLFPINHLDMKLRHFLKSCTRETIGFNKNEMGLIDRYILFAVLKNFMRSKFVKKGGRDAEKSPGMIIGLTKNILEFKDFFNQRLTKHHVNLRAEWVEYYVRKVRNSQFRTVGYCGV